MRELIPKELIVVTTIIAILTAIAIPKYLDYKEVENMKSELLNSNKWDDKQLKNLSRDEISTLYKKLDSQEILNE